MSNLDVDQVAVLDEINRLMEQYSLMMVTGSPIEWVTMVAMLQLAVRHPAVTEEQKAAVNKVCGSIQAMISEASEPLGLMLESGWHTKYDVTVRDYLSDAVRDFVLGVVTFEGDGDAQIDASYHVPVDHLDDRWQHEVFLYGVGDTKYVIHAFWSLDMGSLEIYRMILGLLPQIEPVPDSDDLSWMENYDG